MASTTRGHQFIIRSSRELTDDEAARLEEKLRQELATFGLEHYEVVGRRRKGMELAPRQRQIITLVRDGLSNREIAQHLGISEQTVKNTMMGIIQKLDATNRTDAVLEAIRRGEIELGSGVMHRKAKERAG